MMLPDDFEEKVEAELARLAKEEAARVRKAFADALATSKGWIGLYSLPKNRRQPFYDQADNVLANLAMQGLVIKEST